MLGQKACKQALTTRFVVNIVIKKVDLKFAIIVYEGLNKLEFGRN